jgi:valyl-tRNA synthetase
VMPFLTEELWQRLAEGATNRPKSIARARYPDYQGRIDADAEIAIGWLQSIVTETRAARAEMKLDPKALLDGVLYLHLTSPDMVRAHEPAIQKLASVKLEIRQGAAPPSAAHRSTSEFDLVLNVPQSHTVDQRKRLEKEREQLEKNIANSNRQLGDETFLSRAPAKVVEGLKTKLADYETQLQKVRAALNGLSS